MPKEGVYHLKQSTMSSAAEKNVGILGIEVYTPSSFVVQSKLEEHYGVAQGKYTIGLGQEGLGICGDAEDINRYARKAAVCFK